MTEETPKDQLQLSRQHLERVQGAWDDPTDWADLSLYGFYCLEAAIMAAVEHLGWPVKRSHLEKAKAAKKLFSERGLPDITDLLWELNSARKATAYGDIALPELDAEDVAIQVEAYVAAVEELIK